MNHRYLFALLVASLWMPSVFAQAVAGGQIQGIVTDPSGAAVASATITVDQTESGLHRSTTTGPDGTYVLPNLPVGPYTLNAQAAGFNSYRQTGIVIRVGGNLQVNVSLTLGAVTEQVQVSASATMVQTEDTAVSEVIDQRRIADLPLNGRQPTQLILLSGAATTAPAGDLATTKNYPSSVTISVAGGQANGTNFLLDGGDNNDAFSNVNLPFPFPDALQEFSVQTTGLSARYGLHPGAVVNIVTKSGSNAFHGNLFEFLRNGDLNARNFFAASHDSLRRNQYGGTFGGPIVRNKLFFFAGYQSTVVRTSPPQTISFVQTQDALVGNFAVLESGGCQASGRDRTLIDPVTSQPFPNNQAPVSRFSPQALALLKFVPAASNPCGKLTYGVPNPNNENQFIGRADWNQNDKHTLFVRYFIADFSNPPVFDGQNLLTASRPGLADRSQSLVFGDTLSLTSSLVNSLHATGTRLSINRGSPANMINPTTVGIPVSVAVPNYLDVRVGSNFSLGCGVCIPSVFNDNSIQLSDDVDWIRGKHHFSFGADWIHNQLNTTGASNENGIFTFNGQFTGDSLVDFMLGRPSDFVQGNPTGGNFRQNYIGLYFQDDMRLSPRLAVHAGLRWEPFFPQVDIYGRGPSFSKANFDQGVRSAVFTNAPVGLLFQGDKGVPPGYVEHRLPLFEPRIGFAWDPTGKGRQSLRGSYTIGYDTPEVFYEARYETNAPWGSSIDLPSPAGGLANPWAGYPGGNPFPLPFPPSRTQAFPPAGVYVTLPMNLRPTYMQQWNLSYQYQLTMNWVLTASYIGNKTTHLWAGTELNPAVYVPGGSTTGNTNQRRVLALENTAYGAGYSTLAQTDDGANASFNALVLTAEHRFARNYTVLANYTWSHCLSSTNFGGDVTGPTYQNPSNRAADYGNCSFDLRHNFNGSLIVKSPKFSGAWTNRLFGNWQLAPLFVVHSGTPLNPVTGLDNSRTGVGLDRPDVVGDPYLRNLATRRWLNRAAFQANALGTFGNAGAWSVIGPGFFDIDASLSRVFQAGERVRLEPRAEFFNLFNHTNFQNPANSIQNPNFGVLLGANDPRILQFSLKLAF